MNIVGLNPYKSLNTSKKYPRQNFGNLKQNNTDSFERVSFKNFPVGAEGFLSAGVLKGTGRINPADIDKLSGLIGEEMTGLIKTAIQSNIPLDETQLGMINSIANLRKVLEELQSRVPCGEYRVEKDKLFVTYFKPDSATNTIVPKTTEICIQNPRTKKPVKVFGPNTDAMQFKEQAFSVKPYVTVGPVGWTKLKPAIVEANGFDLSYWGDERAKVTALAKAYAKGTMKLVTPVYDYLLKAGCKRERMAYVTSATNEGVDEIFMTHAKKRNIPTATIIPYQYAAYMDKNHRFPLLITNNIARYGDTFSDIADITLITGGRDHVWHVDLKDQLVDNKKWAIPVDVLREYSGIEIPATNSQGDLENSARLLLDRGFTPPSSLDQLFGELPENELKAKLTTPSQQLLAVQMYKKYIAGERAARIVA